MHLFNVILSVQSNFYFLLTMYDRESIILETNRQNWILMELHVLQTPEYENITRY